MCFTDYTDNYLVKQYLFFKNILLKEQESLKKQVNIKSANLISALVDSTIKYNQHFGKYSHGFEDNHTKTQAKQNFNELLYDVKLIKSTAQWFTVPFGLSTYKSFPIPSVAFKERKRQSSISPNIESAAELMKKMIKARTEKIQPNLYSITSSISSLKELSEEEIKCFYYLLDLPIPEKGDGPFERHIDFMLTEIYSHFDDIFMDDLILATRIREISEEEEQCAKIDRCIGLNSSLTEYFTTKEAVLSQSGLDSTISATYEKLSKLIPPIIFNTIIVSH